MRTTNATTTIVPVEAAAVFSFSRKAQSLPQTNGEDSAGQAAPGMPTDAHHAQAIGDDAVHLRQPVHAFLVVHGNIQDSEAEPARAEEQLIVAPEVSDSPLAQVRLHAQPVAPPEDFGAAQRVLDALIQQ